MTALYPNTDTWVRGEISPRLHARASLDLYRAGLAKCLNWLTLPHGGIRRRGGSYFVGEVKSSTQTVRLIPFVFSSEQAYCLEFGNGYMRVYAYGARVGTVELATSWVWEQLDEIQYYQSADQMWIAHPSHPLHVLTRVDHTTWTLSVYPLDDGPYLPQDESGAYFLPTDYGSATPIMTSNVTPSGTVASNSGSASAWQQFDKDEATDPDLTGSGGGWLSYTFGGGVAKVVDAYAITLGNNSNIGAPSRWKFEGDNGTTWVTLDSRSAETGWTPGEKRFYEMNNVAPYFAYRFIWNGLYAPNPDVGELRMAEISMNVAGDTQTPWTLTLSSASAVNGGAGFSAADISRTIRLKGSDNHWRWARIVTVVNATTVTVRLYGHALPDLSPITQWRMGALTAARHASSVTVYEERLALSSRFSAYLSKSFNLEKFSPGEEDDAGMEFTNAGGGQANDIVWMADGDGYLLLATSGGIRSLAGSGVDEALTPSSFKNRSSRTQGAAKIGPADTGSSFLYVTRGRHTIAELTMNQYGRFVSEDIGQVSEHLTKKGVKAIAYQENPDPVLYFALDNGELGAFTHQPSQEVRGMHRHRLASTTVVPDVPIIESICVTPGADGQNDDVWVCVWRQINGVNKRFIEILMPPIEGDAAALQDAFHVDCGLSYSGVATNTLSGLTHLAGENVDVLDNGKVYKGLTVSGGGVVTLPGGATTTRAHVGLAYASEADTLELDVGARDGSAIGRRKKVAKVILSLYQADTTGLEIKSLMRGAWEPVRIITNVADDGNATFFTGNIEVPIDDSWEGMGKISIRHANPTPCTIRAATLVFDQEP